MANGSITRADIICELIKETGLSRRDCAEIFEAALAEIAGRLIKGDPVRIPSFATFSVRHKKERMGHNPKTGEEVPILPRKVVKFTASQKLKLRLNR